MFKKAMLIISGTLFIAQLASFYEKNYITSESNNYNNVHQISAIKNEHIREYLISKEPIKKTSPKLHNNKEIIDKEIYMDISFYTLLNMKSSNFVSNL